MQQCELLGWKGQDISPGMDGSIERFIIKSSEKRRNPDNDSIVKGTGTFFLFFISYKIYIYILCYRFFY